MPGSCFFLLDELLLASNEIISELKNVSTR